MSKLNIKQLLGCGFLLAPLAGMAQTTFFTDTFGSGSTINSKTPAAPTATSASYQTLSGKTWSPASSVAANDLRFGIAATGSGAAEIQAVFATNAIPLTAAGDYIELILTFTNSAGILTASDFLGMGLYNSGQVYPVPGGLNGTATSSFITNMTGFAQNWVGYVGQVSSASSRIMTRQAQTNSPTGNNDQDLVTSGSSSQSYSYPQASTVGTAVSTAVTLTNGATYTQVLTITMNAVNSLAITNILYGGSNTNGLVISQVGAVATNATYLTAGFDGLAIGWYKKSSDTSNTMDIASIQVIGQSTTVSTAPVITSEPVAVTVPAGAAGDFEVAATGFNLTYQWHRNGTNLADGGNVSGAQSSKLVISPASAADVASGNNGYWVTVSGAGGFYTNSVTNSLSLGTAKILEWTDATSDGLWNLNGSANWQNQSGTAQTFNFGDRVTFDDVGGGGAVSLNGFLSASSVTVSNSVNYTFSGSGGITGPGSLLYMGTGQLSLNCANTFTGGFTISNASALLYVQNLAGLGNGPVTLAQAGGKIELVPAGNSGSGINGDLVVNDDFMIQADTSSAYGMVFMQNISGVSGKTLTLDVGPANGGATRVRVFGTNTVCNCNLNLANAQILYAPYSASGSQTYNGLISGSGALMQKGTLTYLNGANTFSGGLNVSGGAVGLGLNTAGSADAVTSGPLGTGPLLLTVDSTSSTTGSGQVFASGGARTIGNSIQFPTGTNNCTLVVGGTNNLTFAGTFTLSGNDGVTSNSIIMRTVQVTNTGATIFAGTIRDTASFGYGLIKTGIGALYLDGTASYTGWTTNNSGGNTNYPGLLAGAGSIAGPVFIQTNSAIGGGSAAGIGSLTINNNLVLNGNGWFRLNKSLSQSNDQVVVTGTLTNTGTGTITVANLNTNLPISVGDKFILFSKAVSNGAAMNIAGAGMNWTNLLAVDGSIQALSVVSTTASYPTNVSFSFTGNTLNIGWPATHQGWIIQVQTNQLGTGLSTASNAWHDVTSTGSGTNYTLTVSPTNSSVYFRLRHP